MQSCYHCGSESVEVSIIDKYHYTECGLEDVYLAGIKKYVCNDCGVELVELPRMQQLHRAIGQRLCLKKEPLTGKEVAFLRKEMRKNGREFALMLSTSAEHLSRSENGKDSMSLSLDTLVRALYTIYACEGLVVKEGAIDAFAVKREKSPHQSISRIELTPSDWLMDSAVCSAT